jgi:hypothetical protein
MINFLKYWVIKMRKSRITEITVGSICVVIAIIIVWLAGINDPYKN